MSTILTIDQLLTPLTPLQVKTKIYDILARLNVSTTNWKPGGVTRLMISAVSIILSIFSLFISMINRSRFVSMSQGDWLTLVARYDRGVERALATFASGSIALTNTQGGSFTPAADAIVFSNPLTGKTYRNTSPFSLGANSSVTIPIRADVAGAAGSTGPATITNLVTTMIGVTCSNPGSLIGTDDQSDDSLIADCMLKPQSLSPNGPRGAYIQFAKSAVRGDGTNVGVNRATVSNSSTTGVTTVTIATPSGAVSGTETDYATDLGAVFKSIAENCLPECVTLHVVSAASRVFDIQFIAYWKNLSVPLVTQQATVEPVVEQWLANMDIGGVTIPGVCSHILPRDTLRDIISGAFVTRPDLVVVVSPATDLTLSSTEVPEPGTITAAAA